jgi:lysophospholipase L1-like esterase
MSTNKTEFLNMNDWVGTDPFRREELNANFRTLDAKAKEHAESIGDLTTLGTTEKGNLVGAVNEVKTSLADMAKKSSVPTTINWDWSTSLDNYTFTENGNNYSVKGVANTNLKKVLFVGSSVLYGQGATNNMGWARLVAQNLVTKGYTVTNRGIPGDNTGGVLARWYKDVVPYRPDIVVIGLNLTNENIQGQGTIEGKRTIYQTFKKNMKEIIFRTKQMGAIPFVASPYPSGAYSVDDYYFAKLINKDIEAWGVPTLNLLNIGDDGTGKWYTGMTDDGLHPNDSGAQAIQAGVNEEIFDNSWRANPFEFKKTGSVKTGVDATNLSPMELKTNKTLKSFTVFFKMKPNDGAGTYVFFSSIYQDARLRNTSGNLEYIGPSGASIMTDAAVKTQFVEYDICLTYNDFTHKVRMYVNGVFKGEVSDTLDNRTICFGGGATPTYNAKNTEYREILVYRVPLNDEQVKQLSKGNYYKSGLELYSPLHDTGVRKDGEFTNYAPTNSYLKVNVTDLTSL